VAICQHCIWAELTAEQAALRHRLELRVERAWGEIEVALQELRDRQLYRSTHQSFEHYLRERFASFVQEQSPIMALES